VSLFWKHRSEGKCSLGKGKASHLGEPLTKGITNSNPGTAIEATTTTSKVEEWTLTVAT
jgi:hypothetical protein